MCFSNRKLFFVFFVSFLVLLSCDKDDGNFYTDSESALRSDDMNEYSDSDYSIRPDSDHRPGGGGSTTNDHIDNSGDDSDQYDGEIDDESTMDDENSIYSTSPDVTKCVEGTISSSEKQTVLDRVNYIRSLHNLPQVTYEEDDDVYTAQCALIIAANQELSHTPDDSWKCYSDDAYTGCNKSNIYIQLGVDNLSFQSTSSIDSFMTDEGVDTLGHRRWIIDPWLAHVSFGRADDFTNKVTGTALKVINTEQQDISDSDLEFVAYPYKYYPAEFYNDEVMMSFTVIADTIVKSNNSGVDFLTAAVSISDPNNNFLTITGRDFDNDGYGVPNNLRWFAESVESGVKYTVNITGVLVDGKSKSYSYWFELK